MNSPLRCAAAAALLLAAACGYRTRGDMQRDYARTLRPAELEPAPAAAATAVRTLRVRIHVDEDYRAQVLRWRQRIGAQLERANAVLERQFGVRLEPGELRTWAHAGAKRPLPSALEDLVAEDPGGDVDWVIGFVSSTGVATGGSEQLGLAQMFGKHLVLRGMISVQETDAIHASLDALSEGERDRLLADRLRHRETAVLLHEWAHTLGAFHEKDSLMSPSYDISERGFSATGARLVRLGLERRGDPDPAARRAWAAAYREDVERSRAAAWDAASVEKALQAAAFADAAPGTAVVPPPRADALPPTLAGAFGPAPAAALPRTASETALLVQAELDDRLGDAGRAWKAIRPVAATHPDRPLLRRWACGVRARAERRASPAAECRGAKPLSARRARLLFARVLAEAGDANAALGRALEAETAFGAVAPGVSAAAVPPADWAELANVLAELDACTFAERVAERAPREERSRAAAERCGRIRKLTALPAGCALDPAREPAYVAAAQPALALARAGGRAAAARAAAAALSQAFPEAPGGPLARCLAEADASDVTAIRAACGEADRLVPPWTYEPAYVLGMTAGGEGRWEEARDHLRRALEREGHDPWLWARLGRALEKLGDRDGLAALDARHRAVFGGAALRTGW